MLRLSRLIQQQGYATQRPALTEFARRASLLKKRFRGRGQYQFARTEAQRFLDAEVPKSNVNAWMENSCNAIALSQVLRFFEVQPDATLSSLLLNNLVRAAEDKAADAGSRLEAVLALTSMRPEENYERAFTTVESVLKQTTAAASQPGGPTRMVELWGVLDLSAKVLQRCGKRVPTALSERLTNAVMAQLRVTDVKELPALQSSLLRIYSWMVRAERFEARQLLFALVTHTGDFMSFNYSTLMLSCWRHHQLHPLPIDLCQKLARTGLQYCTVANGRDAAAIVSTIAKILNSLEVGKNEVQLKDRCELQNRFNALLEDYRPRVLRFMDDNDKLYWKHSDDVTAVVFAFEMGGHMRYRAVFEAYATYVSKEVAHFEPTQLAMATGILRRAHLLTPQLAAKLSERIEVILGELKLAELSHICATFAALPQRPAWMPEAKAVALRLPTSEASGLTLLNLALAFPDDEGFVSRVPYDKLAARQLVDTLPLVLGSSRFETPVVAALMTRLADPTERLSPDDVRVLLSCNRPQLATAVGSYLTRRFTEPDWDTDTLYYLPLVVPSGQFGSTARNPAKALAAAQAASISPEQFVSLVELLVTVFGDSDAGIATFVRTGGQDLLTAEKVLGRTAVRYLAAVRGVPSLRPSEEWLSSFAEKLGTEVRSLKPEELESLLISLHAVYGDVGRTPALQLVLSQVVEESYSRLTTADAQTARLTVLVVYLQRGMNFPLLTAQTDLVKQIQAAASTLPKDVSDAVATMPLPAGVSPHGGVQLGRFTLKQVPTRAAGGGSGSADAADADADDGAFREMQELDLSMEADPFASPLANTRPNVEAAPAVAPSAPERPKPTQPESAQEGILGSLHPAAEDPHTQREAGETPRPEPVDHGGNQSHKERQTSYYTKFFNSSVGQLFMGKGAEDEDDVPRSTAAAAAATPVEEAPLRPRRTRLAPTTAPTPAATVAEEEAATPVNTPPGTEERPPVPGGFFASWGAPPTFPGTPQPQQPQPPSTAWGPTPAAATAAGSTSTYGIPTSTQNDALFSSLFDRSSSSSAAAAPPLSQQQQQQQQQQHPPTAFSSIFNDGSTNGGLQMPSGAVDPSARPPLIRSAHRPVITRKAVITRGGAGGGPAPPGQQQPTAQVPSFPSNAAAANSGTPGNGSSTAYADPFGAAPRQQGGTPAAGRAAEAEMVVDAPAAGAKAGGTGVADFMNRVGVTKVSGYNMDGADGGEDAGAPQQPLIKDRPLAWQEAARQVGRISRHGKTKTRTRAQQSLSEWLNEPAKKLSDAVGAGAAAGGAADSAAASSAAAKGRGRGRKAAATATTDAAPSAAAHGKGRGRGKAAAHAAAASPPAAKKGAKKAAPKKASAAKPKPKASGAAKAKKAKAAAPKPAAKPKPKKAPAVKKTPAKKAAPAKKPAAKKSAGKGKKK